MKEAKNKLKFSLLQDLCSTKPIGEWMSSLKVLSVDERM